MNWKPISELPQGEHWQLLAWVNVGNGSVAYIVAYINNKWIGVPKNCEITHWSYISEPS